MTANLAKEFDDEARAWLLAFETETKPIAQNLFQAHRAFTGFCTKMSAGAVRAREVARTIIGKYEYERRMEQQRLQREAERLALEEAERERKARADHLLAQAAAHNDESLVTEAIAVEQEELAPVVAPLVETIKKIEGTSVASNNKVGSVLDIVALARETLIGLTCFAKSLR